ncbi:MAG TPA: PIN domain-containing protein [Phycisphaerae bacterium]|nr:PIN domain-containing protein [Phycisphaerae bacterium]
MILIDTSVWSLGLRRRRRDLNPVEVRAYYAWETLLNRGEASIIGPVRQEVLSGISSRPKFDALASRLALIDDLHLPRDAFIRAAEFYNICKSHGITPETVDMTICAAADLHGTPIFTTDPDFPQYAQHLPISLFRF